MPLGILAIYLHHLAFLLGSGLVHFCETPNYIFNKMKNKYAKAEIISIHLATVGFYVIVCLQALPFPFALQ